MWASLDDDGFLLENKLISQKVRTGVIYNISLPSNFSDMEVSILRQRGSKLWDQGANFSYIDVPPRVLTLPYVRRVGIICENFRNWSSHYHELPGYTFVTAIVGIAMYDATDLSGKTKAQRLNIETRGEPVTIKFRDIRVPKGGNTSDLTCVMFSPSNGDVELSNMTRPNVCSWRDLGHFGIAMPGIIAPVAPPPSPSPPRGRRGSPRRKRRKDQSEWKWWVIGFAAGLAALGLLVLISVVCYTTFASGKIKKMERRAEKSESLGTIWIGNSRMPSASMTRTQASNLENDSTP
ncbi:hypothetical protein Cgig2_030417 [Carnegiea gigantea]|uniref:Uncharacterized protein n=1 Tax=Carnegiea gigantea TaxID=171969 RepID=A0A9Q1KJY9_9CARY|nr:hypothetical protein Cgig2_030417 [Carnegiea gigantea]